MRSKTVYTDRPGLIGAVDVRPCRPNTWGGRLADYLDRRHHAKQIKHFGQRPLGFLRVMIFTPNQVKLRSARSGDNKLTKTKTKVYVCRATVPKGIRLSLYPRLGCPSHRALLLGR